MKQFRGTGVAMVTPFADDFSVDVAALQRLTQHLIQGGVEYLVVLGTTGEGATLTASEKELVIRTVMTENAGRLPIVLGCGGNNTAEVVKQIAEWTETFRPDAFLSVCPYYNKPTQEGIYQHFRAVCAATPLPVILYNVPGRTVTNMLPATVLRIAADCPNVIGVKEASGSFSQAMDLVAGRKPGFLLISGDDDLTLPYVACGYDGVITVAANAFPAQYSRMVRHCLAGNFEAARPLQYSLLRVMGLHFKEGNPAGVKASLDFLGVCGPQVRLPLIPASDALRAEIRAAFPEA